MLPPGVPSVDALHAIHQRLSNDDGKWARTDVLGILMAAYGMLLRSSPAAMSSPRAGTVAFSTGSGIDLRKTLRDCLESPAKFKSFTFARICLIPAVNKPKLPSCDELFNASDLRCDVTEFLLSVLAEFGSQFLDTLSSSGECPVSRARWEQDMEEALQVRRDHERKQREFHGQFGDISVPDTFGCTVPLRVDLLERPDCMDDVIAFATAVCSLGPAYVLPFWLQENKHSNVTTGDAANEVFTLSPSLSLESLKTQMQNDESLEATFMSFLAALALAKNPSGEDDGAAIVHSMFSNDSHDSRDSNWTSIIETLRRYVVALDPQSKTSRSVSGSAKANSGKSSTAYYYDQGDLSEKTSSGHHNVDATSMTRSLELSRTSSFHLMSHLAVVANVASRSPTARKAISSMHIPIFNADKSVIGQDSALMVLFRLSQLPLEPEHRGAVFGTLATLISVDGATDEEAAEMRTIAYQAWELLEQCQIIPISLLEQYPSPKELETQNSAALLFPLSLTSVSHFISHQCTS